MLLKHFSRFSVILPAMCTIQSYVFLDLETTGIPYKEIGNTKITELSLVGVLKKHLYDADPSRVFRVLNKLNLCFNPRKHISPGASKVTGLSNELLEEQASFDANTFDLIEKFLSRMPGPICFVAHNGNRFDFPILQAEVKYIGRDFPESSVCVDSLLAFRDLKVREMNFNWSTASSPAPFLKLEEEQSTREPLEGVEELTLEETVTQTGPLPVFSVAGSGISSSKESHEFESEDEDLGKEVLKEVDRVEALYGSTPQRGAQDSSEKNPPPLIRPRQQIRNGSSSTPGRGEKKVKRRLFPAGGEGELASNRARKELFPSKPQLSYKLGEVYKAVKGKELEGAHSAEVDALALVEIVSAIGAPFHEWAEANYKKMSSINRLW